MVGKEVIKEEDEVRKGGRMENERRKFLALFAIGYKTYRNGYIFFTIRNVHAFHQGRLHKYTHTNIIYVHLH